MAAGNLVLKTNKRPFYKKRLFFLWLIVGVAVLLFVGYLGLGAYIASEFTKGKVHDLGPDTPATYEMAYENITYKTADNAQLTIRGWWIPRPDSKRVLIMVHAKDGTRTFLLPLSYRLWQEGFKIFDV